MRSSVSSPHSPRVDGRDVRRTSFFDPDIDRHLLRSEGEYVVDEVVKHPVTMVWPVAQVFLGIVLVLSMAWFFEIWLLPLVGGLFLAGRGTYQAHERFMDRFVITNMRVFRVNGVFQRHVATMPLARILDVSVYQPFIGNILNYGHLTFESAAQDQGLREIRFVGDPNARDLTIQRVIQRAGIRAMAGREEDDGT